MLRTPRPVALLVVLLATGVTTQTPQQQPRVQASDVVYLGTIRSPLEGGQHGMAVQGDTWYWGCIQGVATLTLPPIGGTASVITPCAPLPNVEQMHPHDRDVHVGGILPWNGRLIVSAWVYYDAGWGQRASHYAGTGPATLAGPFPMATPFSEPPQGRQRMVAGYMGVVPPEWRSLLGGPALTGQSNIPIVGNSSHGPSVSVFDPDHVGKVAPIPATMLVGYPSEHQTLGGYGDHPPAPFYGGTDQLGSVAFPAGTRSVLFTGRHGHGMCYGPGTGDKTLVGKDGPGAYPWCYDPDDEYQGAHGPPYAPTMWAYDANDLLAVKRGRRKYWEVKPYATWTLSNWSADQPNLMRAGWYDPATKRYYVGRTDSPEVKVYEIRVQP